MKLKIIQNGPKVVDPRCSLWRYVRLPQLLLLLNGRLSLPSIRALHRHDPLEGRGKWDEIVQADAFTSAEYAELVSYVKKRRLSPNDQRLYESNALAGRANQRLIFEHWAEIVLSTRYALCFFASTHESITMWRQYASDGVAIKTSLPRLDQALSTTAREWRVSRIIYKDLAAEITSDEACNDPDIKDVLRRPFLLKQKEYEGENEMRLITADPEVRPHLDIESISPEAWIEEVRISPDIWSRDATLLKEFIVSRSPKLNGFVHHSRVREEPEFGAKIWEDIEAECAKDDAANHWPEILRKP